MPAFTEAHSNHDLRVRISAQQLYWLDHRIINIRQRFIVASPKLNATKVIR